MGTPSMDDTKSLAAKLNAAGLTEEERTILAAVARRAADATEGEVAGFTHFRPEIDDEVVIAFASIFDARPGKGLTQPPVS